MQVLLLMIAFAGLFLNDIADAFFVIGLGVTTFLSVWKCKWFLIPILFLAWYTSSLDILLIAVCPEKDIILNFFQKRFLRKQHNKTNLYTGEVIMRKSFLISSNSSSPTN